MRHPGVHDIRIPWLQLDIHRSHAIGNEKHLPPGLAAINRLEHAAFSVWLECVAHSRHPNDIRILWMNAHRSDLSRVVKTDELPSLSTIGRLIQAAAGGDVTAHVIRAGAEVDHVRVRDGDRYTPARTERNLANRDRNPI